ncbi:hypothetical protein ACIRPK_04535 [Kitasatospora sp. NPDC101801]|uniref:hypothetical protein n=1 Tax=Kitasatospora sp. NPDC101801 TaxID=3364103 RepID=UPI00382CC702
MTEPDELGDPASLREVRADQMMNEYRDGQERSLRRSTSGAETWSCAAAAVLVFAALAWLLTAHR